MSTTGIAAREKSPTRLLTSAIGVVLASGASIAHAQNADPVATPDGTAGSTTSDGDAHQQNGDTKLETVNVNGNYIAEPASPKFTAPLVDTPRSITILPAQLLQETASNSLEDALRLVPGITFGAGEGGNPQGDRPFIRGFDAQSSTFVDGVRDVGAQSREAFDIDQVEVIKGPDSVYDGRSTGGGSINIVSKQPVAEDFLAGSLGIGTDSYQRATIDLNKRIDDTSAFRLNLLGHDADTPGRDDVSSRRVGFAPSISFGMGTATRSNISFYHLKQDDVPDSGIPYLYGSNAPPDVTHVYPVDGGDRNNFYGLLNRDFRKTQADIGTIRIEHDFGDSLTLRNTTRYGRTRQDYIVSQPDDSQNDVVNGEVWRRELDRAGNTVSGVNQTDLFGHFSLGGIEHDFSSGLELSNEKDTSDRYDVPTIPANIACGVLGPGAASYYNCTTLANPDANDPFVPGTYDPDTGVFTPTPITRVNNPTRTTADTAALYFFDTAHLGERWLFNFGARYDDFSTKAPVTFCPGQPGLVCPRGYSGEKVTEDHRSDSRFLSYQAGLVWKPSEIGSVYVSLATAATPPGSTLNEGRDNNPISLTDLDPETSRNLEVGTKWNLFGERLGFNAALFRTDKNNSRVLDSDGSYQNIGKTRVQGIEIGFNGKINERWGAYAGYTWLDSELVDGGFVNGAPNPDNGNELGNTPKMSLTLWTSYALTPRFSVGGGAYYVDRVWGSTANFKGVPSYWRYDAVATWQVNPNLDLRLNLQNLTDKLYYPIAYSTHFAIEGPGRSVLVTADFKF
ncbi:MAG: TonB-dependent siderophore receptor [Rhodanobacteraceae bacterium]